MVRGTSLKSFHRAEKNAVPEENKWKTLTVKHCVRALQQKGREQN